MEKSVLIQKTIRDNNEDLMNFMRDMQHWEKDMKLKDAELSSPNNSKEAMPPVRSKLLKEKKQSKKIHSEVPKKTKKVSTTDYSSWDKFDADKACEEVEKDDSSSDIDREEALLQQALLEKEMGNDFVKEGKWREAIQHYTNAINLSHKDAVFFANRALCYLKTNQFTLAEKDCTKSVEIDSQYVKAYQRRAAARMSLNKYSEAESDLNFILKLEPNNLQAKQDLEKLDNLKIDQNEPVNKTPKVFNSIATKNVDKEILKKSLQEKELGNDFVKRCDWTKAKDHYTNAIELNPEESLFYANRALCYLKLDQFVLAEKDCNLCLSKKSNYVKAYQRRAVARIAMNKFKEAELDLRTVIELEPINLTAKQDLKKLLSNENYVRILENDRFFGPVDPARIIKPIYKSPHLRSKKPLKNINIVDVDDFTLEKTTLIKKEPNKVVSPPEIKNENNINPENVLVQDIELPPPAKTSVQFYQALKKLKGHPDLLYQYLKSIKGSNLPNIFQDSLESDAFSSIIDILSNEFLKHDSPVVNYLVGLTGIRRFDMLVLFMTKKDKEGINKLIEHSVKKLEITDSNSHTLKKKFRLI